MQRNKFEDRSEAVFPDPSGPLRRQTDVDLLKFGAVRNLPGKPGDDAKLAVG